VISGFRREVDENCALLGCYAARSGNFYRRFRTTYRCHHQGFKNPKFLFLFGFLSLVIIQGLFVVFYRRFGTTYPFHSQASRIKIFILIWILVTSYYAARIGNFLPMFRDNLLVISSRVKDLESALQPRRAQFSGHYFFGEVDYEKF